MVSEKVTPELAKCYDEIDQIYDYIRGLVPLPPQLRKIKSIDFEQLERDKRLLEQQQVEKLQQHQVQPRPTKPRQRQANDGASEQLKSPQESRLDQPKAFKLTLSSGLHRPTVKRVESLNLGSSQPAQAQLTRPSFLIGARQRGQQFRLPRAHSTSTLSKPADERLKLDSCTLPALSSAKLVSLARLRGPLGAASVQPSGAKAAAKLQSVESYIDEHTQSSSSQLSSSSDCDARSPSATSSSSSSATTSTGGLSRNEDDDKTQTIRSSDSRTRGNGQALDADDELNRTRSRAKNLSEVHSDYENDNTSDRGSAGASLSDLLAPACPSRRSRGSQEASKRHLAPAKCEPSREHIYEQIPAHKAPVGLAQQPASKQATRAGAKPDAAVTAHLSRAQQPKQVQLPFNYPIAFTPNVALRPLQHGQQACSSSLKPSRSANSGHPSRPFQTSGARAPSMHNLSATPAPIYLAPFGSSQVTPMRAHLAYQRPVHGPTRPLSEHRHRLSIGNLHHLMAAHPLLSAHLTPPSSLNKLSLARSTQSAKQQSRAPRLSPAELIAQIQVPRAVSKRQVQPPLVRPVWQHPTTKGAIKSGCSNGVQAQSGRNSSRRLTAIGIEHTLAATSCELPTSQQESARAKAEAFMRNRCQNSISDIHSASQSGSSDLCTPPTNLSKSSPESSSLSDEDESTRVGAQQNSDQGNFVSSRSFIKCYYGRERSKASGSSRTSSAPKSATAVPPIESQTTKEDTQRQALRPCAELAATKAKRRTSKLLNLIGLNRLVEPMEKRQAVSGRGKPAESNNHDSLRRVQPHTKARLTGEFLNDEGPILVRDRRILALRPELVCHFEHPTVQVSKLPSKHRLDPGSSVTLASTDTSNSTSSYEAAIKHGGERAAQLAQAAPERSSDKGKRQPTSGSSLFRVPKLSRQSHLLNRPLPKPPVPHHRRSATGATSSGHQQAAQRRQAASQPSGGRAAPQPDAPAQARPLALTQAAKPTPVLASKRASLSPLAVSIGAHQPSPTVTTCTSSGISSRMTAAAPTSGASNASSLASHKGARSRVKSLSELHKQAKLHRAAELVDAQPIEATTVVGELALMDASEPSSPEPTQVTPGRMEPLAELRLFDERFSSDRCFADQQLASSSDSLLESINFSGTLAARNKHRKPAVPATLAS